MGRPMIALCFAALVSAPGWAQQADMHAEHAEGAVMARDANLDLAAVVTAAEQRNLLRRLDTAGQQRAEADVNHAGRWLAASPAVSMYYRDFEWSGNTDGREMELTLKAPLWLPGERSAAKAVAAGRSEVEVAVERARRLDIAGRVRQSIWMLLQAQADYELVERQVGSARELTATVRKLREAGDASEAEVLQAINGQYRLERQLAETHAALVDARRQYHLVTGLDALPGSAEEQRVTGDAVPSDHPLLVLARRRVDSARAALELARQSSDTRPEVGVGVRRERADAGLPYINSVALSVQIPITSGHYRRAETARANEQLITEDVALIQTSRQLAEWRHEAAHRLSVLAQRLQTARKSAEIASKLIGMQKLAFDHGEIPFIEYLRSRQDYYAAERERRLAELAWAEGIAMFNQVMGVMP